MRRSTPARSRRTTTSASACTSWACARRSCAFRSARARRRPPMRAASRARAGAWGTGTACGRSCWPPANIFRAPSAPRIGSARAGSWASPSGLAAGGWDGDLIARYFLFRDRKGVVTALFSIIAYVLSLNYLLLAWAWRAGWLHLDGAQLAMASPWMQSVLAVNAVLLVNRLAQRVYFVGRLNGPLQACCACPGWWSTTSSTSSRCAGRGRSS